MTVINEMFGRVNANGDIVVLMIDDGSSVTKIDANVYPVGSSVSAHYEHAEGIVLTIEDAKLIKLEIES